MSQLLNPPLVRVLPHNIIELVYAEGRKHSPSLIKADFFEIAESISVTRAQHILNGTRVPCFAEYREHFTGINERRGNSRFSDRSFLFLYYEP